MRDRTRTCFLKALQGHKRGYGQYFFKDYQDQTFGFLTTFFQGL